jgi:hypothetical protein
LPSSRISVGALQYTNTTPLTLHTTIIGAGGVDATAQATSLYYIYAVISNGALALIGSTNSVLPSGFTQGKIIGGFTTDGNSQIDTVGEYAGNLSVTGTGTFGAGLQTPPTQNYLINGGFDFWQRATSGTVPADTTGIFVADRWRICDYNNAYTTLTRSATPVTVNSIYSCTVSTSNTSLIHAYMYQNIESATMIPLIGRTVTFSIKVKKLGTQTGEFRLGASYLGTKDTAGGSFMNDAGYTLIKYTSYQWAAIPTDSYLTATLTFSVPTTAVNGVCIYIGGSYMTIPATGNIFSVGEAMMNVGSVAAPFQRAGSTIGGELALCQRYFHRPGFNFTTAGYEYYPFCTGMAISTTDTRIYYKFPVVMRKAITSGDMGNSGTCLTNSAGNILAVTSMPVVSLGADGVNVNATVSSGLVAGNATILQRNGLSGYIDFSAEI